MRKLLFIVFVLLSHVMLAQRYSSFIKDLPKPARVVNDFGGFLSATQKNNLEKELIAYRKKSGNAIVIITLSTLTDYKTGTTWSVEETALQYFSKWGIGDKVKNNGVLILLSKEPRRIRITTGTGVENVLTDNECQRIIDETIVPNFKSGQIYAGLKEGLDEIKTTLTGKTQVADDWATSDKTAQPQPVQQAQQQQTPYVSSNNSTREPPKPAQIIGGLVLIAFCVWLRAKYVSKREGSGADYLKATGWVLKWVLIIGGGWLFILIYKMSQNSSSGYRGSYYHGYDRGYSRGSRSYNSGNSGGSSYRSSSSGSSGSSSEGSGSYGGGRSNGGGASGSW